MAFDTSAGTVIGLTASSPSTLDAAGYAALSFTLIGEVTQITEFGREVSLVTHQPMASRATRKLKGSYNYGQVTVSMASDRLDAGQLLVLSLLNSDSDVIVWISTGAGDQSFHTAQLMSFKEMFGGVNDVTGAAVVFEINDLFEIGAASFPGGSTLLFTNPDNSILMGVI